MATAASMEAGQVIRSKVGAAVIKTKANPIDLLTEVDGEVQALLESAINDAFPAHGFLVRDYSPPSPPLLPHQPSRSDAEVNMRWRTGHVLLRRCRACADCPTPTHASLSR